MATAMRMAGDKEGKGGKGNINGNKGGGQAKQQQCRGQWQRQ
jgi:hypothetical protein